MTLAQENRRILIVDDSEAIHQDFRRILEVDDSKDQALRELAADMFGDDDTAPQRTGYELQSAYQGQEALGFVKKAKVAESPFSLAFVDMRMPPGWDGLETIKHLWEVDPELQVVICTAFSDHSWEEIVDSAAYPDQLLIIKKPFATSEVSQMALALTRKWQLSRTVHEQVENLEKTVDERTHDLQSANERLKENQKQLVHSEKMAGIGQLAAGVAHEINNPVGFIKSNIGTLSEYVSVFKTIIGLYEQLAASNGSHDQLLAEIRAFSEEEDISYLLNDVDTLLDESAEGLIRVQDIVQNLKSFARLDDSGAKDASINDCIDSTLKIVWNELKYKCTIEKDYGELPPLRCCPGQLNQVFMNLLVNASHAIEEQGVIRIRTRREESWIVIEVGDDGCGIPENKLSKIFEPFFTTKVVGKGTGLGLSISHGIVEKHGGRIDVSSIVGSGTTFTIRLPESGMPEETVFEE